MLSALHQLSTPSLRTLAASLRDGRLSSGLSTYALQQISGSKAPAVHACIAELQASGMTTAHVAHLVDAIADARDSIPLPSSLFDLVLSGPDVPGIPTADTAAVMQTLIEEATDNVLLIGYAVHNGQRLFKRLAEKMERLSSLRVVFCLDIPRRQTDTSLADEVVRRFAEDFREKHWPGTRLPELYYDPRSLSDSWEKRSSLHAKCVAVDRRVALITSANFTEAAQQRNIEAGVIVRYAPFVERLVGYFEGLRASGQLKSYQF